MVDVGYISSNGMVTIPKKFRVLLGFDQQTPLVFGVENGGLVVRKARIIDDSLISDIRRKYGVDTRPKDAIIKDLRSVRRSIFDEEYG